MDRPEYMFIPLTLIPDKFIDKYYLENISNNGKLYLKITKVRYVYHILGS